jgi:asparagine synthase (glutamine-hydrolysing)
MSMANSLEVRVPFLDHGLVEWTLGAGARGERQPDKRSLAHAVSDVVPRDVVTRRKQGFLVPIAEWMAGELRDEVAQRLHDTPRSLGEHVNPAAAGMVWDAFLDGRESWSRPWGLYALWRWVDDLDSRHASSRSLS